MGPLEKMTWASKGQGEQRHQDCRDALAEPVAQTIVGADDDALGTVIDGHGNFLSFFNRR